MVDIKQVKAFQKRWNITYSEVQAAEAFRNRVLSSTDKILGRSFLNKNTEAEYLHLLGERLPQSRTTNIPFDYGRFDYSYVWKILSKCTSLESIVVAIQPFFWMGRLSSVLKDRFVTALRKDIELSNVPLSISTAGGSYVLYPKGAELLDEALVNDNLVWLNDYCPEAAKVFTKALKDYLAGRDPRDVVDKMRLSLEVLLKKVLNNRKGLERQTNVLGQYLKAKGVDDNIRKMYTTLLTYYGEYQNENAKHNDKAVKTEVEFIIYLTGTFARMLLLLEQSS